MKHADLVQEVLPKVRQILSGLRPADPPKPVPGQDAAVPPPMHAPKDNPSRDTLLDWHASRIAILVADKLSAKVAAFREAGPRIVIHELSALRKNLANRERLGKVISQLHQTTILALAPLGLLRQDIPNLPRDVVMAKLKQARRLAEPLPDDDAEDDADSRGQPADHHARLVERFAREAYEDLTRRRATTVYQDGGRHGAYIAYLSEMFELLNIKASVEARAAHGRRRG